VARLSPSIRELLETARRHLSRRDAKSAAPIFEEIVKLDPGNVPALNALGNLAVAARQFDRAIEFHKRAVKADRRNPALRNDLANSLILAGRPQDALKHLDLALAADPKLKPALFNLARARRNLDMPERALECLDRLRELGAAPSDIDIEHATILAQMGRESEAIELFRQVLAERPAEVRAVVALANGRSATPADNDLEAITGALGSPGLRPLHRSLLHQAAGKVLEDLGRDDEAFAQYRLANDIAARPFDMAAHLGFIAETRRCFTREFFAARAGFGSPSERPVFVVGLPRSGTTLIEQILASHPAIAGLGEVTDLERGLRRAVPEAFGTKAFFDALAKLPRPAVRAAAEAYLESLSRRAGNAARFIDKMPHNFLVLGWIALLFPKAAIVHCTRDALDVCTSCYTHIFSDTHAYSNDLRVMGEYYRAYEDLMNHWTDVLPGRIQTVRYEEIVANLEARSRSLVAALGLEWNDACLAFHRTRRIVQTPSQWQVHRPIYASSIGRWQKFQKHLGPLIEGLGMNAAVTSTESGVASG
jgi:tetratricopeptide (TPR) repeat protein